MRRIALFLLTNIAVLFLLSIVCRLFGIDQWAAARGYGGMGGLLIYAAVFGMGGAFISLAMSKWMAKMSTGARVIEQPQNEAERWLLDTVRRHAQAAGIGMPEVGIFDSPDPNAFATGANRNHALVAVSTGLLNNMRRDEVDAVLGHEVSHVANGDMVTLTLIQGVVNTFVVFLSRVVGYVVDKAVFRTERGVGPGYMITVFVCQIVFGIAASVIVAWFSRQREFRADAASAGLLGTPRPMIAALRRLGGVHAGEMPQTLQAFGIAESNKYLALFASHPPIEQRIAALESARA